MRKNMIIILLAGITVLSAGICFSIAKKRGLKKPFWVVMGAVFGPFAIPFVFIAKPKHPKDGVASEC